MRRLENVRDGVRFGPFVFDRDTGRLYKKRGSPQELRTQLIKALDLLTSKSPAIVTREELKASIWGRAKVPDKGLEDVLVELRKCLADSRENPRYIKVWPGRGIQFIASVEKFPIHAAPGARGSKSEAVSEPFEAQLKEEVLAYLEELAKKTAELPPYYPPHLNSGPGGLSGFDCIRQLIQVLEERKGFERWQIEERELLRSGGMDLNHYYYRTRRANPQEREQRDEQRTKKQAVRTIGWDEQAGRRWHRSVILGGPGFGKTWLLRYEARHLAQEASQLLQQRAVTLEDLVLPIFLRLSDLARCSGGIEDGLTVLAGELYTKRFRSWVQEKLKTEHCVILMDAWDEVPVEPVKEGQVVETQGYRQHLGRRLESFARRHPAPRLLMTSRLVGYTSSPIPGAKELEMLAWETSQQNAFVEVWFGVDEREKGEEFQRVLATNHDVRSLGRIPLMLALMCLAYQAGGLSVPTRRVELYDCCLRGLLRDWLVEKQRPEVRHRYFTDAYLEEQLDLLQSVAYDMFREGYYQFGENLLRDKMLPKLEKFKSGHALYGRPAVSLIAEFKNNGILTTAAEHGETKLIFLHRTFQEYLAAGAMADLVKECPQRAWKIIDKRAWDSEWEPVVVYMAARLGDMAVANKKMPHQTEQDPPMRQLKNLLTLLINKRKDDYFRHRLALAAQCLPEIAPRIRLGLSKEVNKITREVVMLCWQPGWEEALVLVPHLMRALPALGQVNAEVEPGESLTTWLTSRLSGRQRIAMQIVGQIGPTAAVPEIVHALIELLRVPELIGCDKDGLPRNLQGFLEVSKWWPGFMLMSTARSSLIALGSSAATPEVLHRLCALMGDENSDVRQAATEAACCFGRSAATTDVVHGLLQLLQDEYAPVRGAAARALGALGNTNPEVVRALQMSLKQALKEEYPIDSAPAEALGALGALGSSDSAEIIHTRLAALEGMDWPVQCVIAKGLGASGSAFDGPESVRTLLVLLKDENSAVRWEAADAVRSLGSTAAVHPEVARAVVELLRGDDVEVRKGATEAVGALGNRVPPEAVYVLLELLQDEDQDQRDRAAEALGALGSAAATPEVLHRLCALMRGIDSRVRGTAAKAVRALGKTAAVHSEIIQVLLELLGENDRNVRSQAASALGALGRVASIPKVLQRLRELVRDRDPIVRRCAAEALGCLGGAADGQALLRLLRDEDSRVSVAAVKALHALGNVVFKARRGSWTIRTTSDLSHTT
jgi:HEAT repeat protein/DNA-binding winged helix-turn-helix (wHTH) protein